MAKVSRFPSVKEPLPDEVVPGAMAPFWFDEDEALDFEWPPSAEMLDQFEVVVVDPTAPSPIVEMEPVRPKPA